MSKKSETYVSKLPANTTGLTPVIKVSSSICNYDTNPTWFLKFHADYVINYIKRSYLKASSIALPESILAFSD